MKSMTGDIPKAGQADAVVDKGAIENLGATAKLFSESHVETQKLTKSTPQDSGSQKSGVLEFSNPYIKPADSVADSNMAKSANAPTSSIKHLEATSAHK